jgi:hypothetical protein
MIQNFKNVSSVPELNDTNNFCILDGEHYDFGTILLPICPETCHVSVHSVYPYPYAPLSIRCTLISTIFGRDENAYKPKRLCRREPLSVRCTVIRTIFGRAEVYG